MKYFLIAGERSGDLHGGNLVGALKEKDPQAEVLGYGGNDMKKNGMRLLSHYSEMSFMGFIEVIANLRTIRGKIKQCKKDIKQVRPDVLILIDFPGFNLRLAKYARGLGIRTAYYISPKIWAWKKGRIRQIRKYVERMYVIFPFEKEFYRKLDYPVEYVGNPLVEHIDRFTPEEFIIKKGFTQKVAFLPGSRAQEVTASVQTIIALAKQKPAYLFLVAGVDNLPREIYEPLICFENIEVHTGKTYEILSKADASITTSGTATLETALFNVPQMVCYRTSTISYFIAKSVVTIDYISLVNLVADAPVVKELIQNEYTVRNVENELEKLLNNSEYRGQMLENYKKIRELLTRESASENTAVSIINWLSA